MKKQQWLIYYKAINADGEEVSGNYSFFATKTFVKIERETLELERALKLKNVVIKNMVLINEYEV